MVELLVANERAAGSSPVFRSRIKVRNKEVKYRSMAKYREKNQLRLWELLLRSSCKDCGEKDPRVLDFDHLGDKKFEISQMVNRHTRSWKAIEEEMAKCEIVCANCHRKRSFARGNTWRQRLFALVS